MENNIVSLETARRLEAAGFPQDSVLYWLKEPRAAWRVGREKFATSRRYAAPTAQELADELSEIADVESWQYHVAIECFGKAGYAASYEDKYRVVAHNMAEALALLWLQLNKKESLK